MTATVTKRSAHGTATPKMARPTTPGLQISRNLTPLKALCALMTPATTLPVRLKMCAVNPKHSQRTPRTATLRCNIQPTRLQMSAAGKAREAAAAFRPVR